MKKKIIYDIGANNGDDIPYYLLKSDAVVAVEANPALCDLIITRFSAEVKSGRLVVENCVVTAEDVGVCSDFYVHKTHHVESQFPPPSAAAEMLFDKVKLPSKSIVEIIERHGDPYYIKLDVEYYDAQILRALFNAGVFPPFVSAEAQSIEVFALLVAQGGYKAFKLVDGYSVSKVYADCSVTSHLDGKLVRYSFPYHSAGPFGDEVDGEWMTADHFVRVLALEGLGWKDVHASRQAPAAAIAPQSARSWLLGFLLRQARFKRREIVARMRQMLGLGRR